MTEQAICTECDASRVPCYRVTLAKVPCRHLLRDVPAEWWCDDRTLVVCCPDAEQELFTRFIPLQDGRYNLLHPKVEQVADALRPVVPWNELRETIREAGWKQYGGRVLCKKRQADVEEHNRYLEWSGFKPWKYEEPGSVVDAVDFDELPPSEYVAYPLLHRGYLSLLTAEGGTGKSTWALQLAMSLAAGRAKFGPLELGSPSTVLMINCDDDIIKQRERLLAAQTIMGITKEELGNRLKLWHPKDSLFGYDREFPKRLDLELTVHKPSLLVLDPLIRFHDVEENSNSQMAQVAAQIMQLAKKHDCAVLILHHPSKSFASANDAASRGASALVGNCRATVFMEKTKDGTVTLSHMKHSYTEKLPPTAWRFEVAGTAAALVPLALEPMSWEGRSELLVMVADGRDNGLPWAANSRARKQDRLDAAVDARWGEGTAAQVIPAYEAAGLICRKTVRPKRQSGGATHFEGWVLPEEVVK